MARSLAKQQSGTQAVSAASANPIRVIIADSQAIFRVGIRKVLAVEDDLRVVAQAESLAQTFSAVAKFPADLLLFESRLSPHAPEAASEVLKRAPGIKIVVIASETDAEQTVEYLRRGVCGIVTRAIAPDLLVRSVRKVAEGEIWLDNRGVNWIIEAYRSQATLLTSPRPKNRLSPKEMLVVSCVSQGMRNKEIAVEVKTSEQVIKNYLRKIYDKLGVSDRLELALYCIHHRLMDKPNGASDATETAASAAPGSTAVAEQ
ncbi:MAG: response regulator transcription factor [Acidobacteriia bacterium]|nr:response regulator transcription factor [Terriglobia bacterium]